MLATESKVRCPTCGTKNPADAARCRICTRTMPRDQTPSQAAYEDALYAQPVRRSVSPARWLARSTMALLVAAGLAYLNYEYIGWGPDWAHEEMVTRGETWRTFTTDEWTAVLPGRPERERLTAATGDVVRYQVGVDDRWVSVIDADILAPAARADGLVDLHAMVMVAEAAVTGPLEDQAASVVTSLQPGTTLEDTSVAEVAGASPGRQVDLIADYRGGTRENGAGEVRARLIDLDGQLYVIAAFVEGGGDTALFEHLVDGFTLDGGRAAPAASN
jgi:hypothetical protein